MKLRKVDLESGSYDVSGPWDVDLGEGERMVSIETHVDKLGFARVRIWIMSDNPPKAGE